MDHPAGFLPVGRVKAGGRVAGSRGRVRGVYFLSGFPDPACCRCGTETTRRKEIARCLSWHGLSSGLSRAGLRSG